MVRRLSLGAGPGRRRRIHVVVAVAVLAATATATAGYGPTTPPGSPVPGAFSTVIASKTFGTVGGTLVAKAGKTRFTLQVKPGALNRRIQFTLTRPRLGNLRKRVPRGTAPTAGVALLATNPEGHFVTGLFGTKPVRLTVVDRRITKRSIVLIWNQGKRRFVRYRATTTAGKATFALNRIHELVVATPK